MTRRVPGGLIIRYTNDGTYANRPATCLLLRRLVGRLTDEDASRGQCGKTREQHTAAAGRRAANDNDGGDSKYTRTTHTHTQHCADGRQTRRQRAQHARTHTHARPRPAHTRRLHGNTRTNGRATHARTHARRPTRRPTAAVVPTNTPPPPLRRGRGCTTTFRYASVCTGIQGVCIRFTGRGQCYTGKLDVSRQENVTVVVTIIKQ